MAWFVITAELSSSRRSRVSEFTKSQGGLSSFRVPIHHNIMVNTLAYTLIESNVPTAAPYQITRRDIPDPSGTYDIRRRIRSKS